MVKNITRTSCTGCQWNGNCEFTCPCDFHTGRDDVDDAVDYIVSLFECIEKYQDIESQFN